MAQRVTGAPAVEPTRLVRVDDRSSVHEARRAAYSLAAAMGFGTARAEELTLAASELASNINKHTRGGELYLQRSLIDPDLAELVAVDDGPGMAEVERCLVDGYSTAGTMGGGLGAVNRLADELAAYSRPDGGTVLLARFRPERPEEHNRIPAKPPGLDAGGIRVPIRGETACGDRFDVHVADGTVTAVHVDGLGHGPEAAHAADVAVEAFRADIAVDPLRPLPEVLGRLHAVLRRTRGAAGTVLRHTVGSRRVDFAGVGTVLGAVLSGSNVVHRYGPRPGVLGAQAPRVTMTSLELPPRGIAVLCSDGVRTHWRLDRYRGLSRQPMTCLAAAVVHTAGRGTDDVSVFAVRLPER